MIWKRFAFFLSLFCAFGFSLILLPSQAQAVELTTQVVPTGTTIKMGNQWRCYGRKDSNWITQTATAYGECPYWTINESQIARVYSNNMINVTEGNYYQVTFIYGSNTEGSPMLQWTLNTREQDWSIVEFKQLMTESMSEKIAMNTYGGTADGRTVKTSVSNIYQITLQAKYTGQTYWFVGWDSNIALMLGYNFQIQMSDIVEFRPATIDSVNQQQQQAGEQAQQDGQQGSSTSQNDAQNASTTLLGAFNGFVGSITAVSPSNCNISGNFGHIDVGTLNLCQDSPPAFVSTILSLVSVALLVPLSIHLAKRMIGLFRSFTNG